MSKLTCFKAYDIRGQLGEELNDDIAYRIGRAFSEHTSAKTVVVGGDVRLTSESLKAALSNGLRDGGTDVIDIGIVGTEEVYFATFHLGVDGGIEITASHNPIDYNGMKLVREEAKPISGGTGLHEIKKLAEGNAFSSSVESVRGTYTKTSVLNSYIKHLLSYIEPSNIKPLTIVINSGNGAAGHVIDALEVKFIEQKIPVKIIKINHEQDGNFPNGIPNPLLPECRIDTSTAVVKYKADLGIAFDGDFDRCFLFNHLGEFIEGYYIVGLLADAFLKKEHGARIVHDPRLVFNTQDIVKSAGGKPVTSKTGHAFIKERMRAEDAIYGGEMSAHHYFRSFAYCDSGMIPWLLIIELLSVENKNLRDLVYERMNAYPASGEINLKITELENAIERVKCFYLSEDCRLNDIDGLSMEFESWRFNLRSSNTEPVVRLNVESKADPDLMIRKTQEILSLLKDE